MREDVKKLNNILAVPGAYVQVLLFRGKEHYCITYNGVVQVISQMNYNEAEEMVRKFNRDNL